MRLVGNSLAPNCAAAQEDTLIATSPSNSKQPCQRQTLSNPTFNRLHTAFLNPATFTMADRKKRDRYAGAAYEFGANSQAGAGAPPPAPGYGAPAPSYGQPAPAYGASSPGYGAPPAAYGAPAPAYGQPAPQDPNALNQQFGQMNLGPQPGQACSSGTSTTCCRFTAESIVPFGSYRTTFPRLGTVQSTAAYPPALECCRYAIRNGKRIEQIPTMHTEYHSHKPFSPQEEQATVCFDHKSIRFPARF